MSPFLLARRLHYQYPDDQMMYYLKEMSRKEGIIMTAASTIDLTHGTNVRRIMWQVVAVAGMTLSSAGILAGATGLSLRIPLPSWSLEAGALFGLVVMALAGARLLSLREAALSRANKLDAVPDEENSWVVISQAFESWRTGQVPVLMLNKKADEREMAAFERGNEAFQFLARRRKVLRAALDDVREDITQYHRYLTRSQVGLIGANSVAERIEDLDKRLAKIRSAV